MMFNLHNRTTRGVAALLAASVLGGSAAAVAAGTGSKDPPSPPSKVAQIGAAKANRASTVPASLKRAETAAEDVIGYLEKGKPAKSRAEARLLKELVQGKAAGALRNAGVSRTKIKALQSRADRVEALSRGRASDLRVSLAANSVSQLMPGLYARYHDPVPAAVLRLDYLDREIQLRSQSKRPANVRAAVKDLGSTWARVRPPLVKAGGVKVARQYDRHIQALKNTTSPASIQKEAVHGLDIVDLMEGVFLGK